MIDHLLRALPRHYRWLVNIRSPSSLEAAELVEASFAPDAEERAAASSESQAGQATD